MEEESNQRLMAQKVEISESSMSKDDYVKQEVGRRGGDNKMDVDVLYANSALRRFTAAK